MGEQTVGARGVVGNSPAFDPWRAVARDLVPFGVQFIQQAGFTESGFPDQANDCAPAVLQPFQDPPQLAEFAITSDQGRAQAFDTAHPAGFRLLTDDPVGGHRFSLALSLDLFGGIELE